MGSVALGDVAAAKADFAGVEDGGLTRGRALDRIGESKAKEVTVLIRTRSGALARVFMLFIRALVSSGISFDNPRRGRQQFPAVAEADGEVGNFGEVGSGAAITQMQIGESKLIGPKLGVIKITRNVDKVLREILFDDVIGQATAEIKTMTLTDSVKNRAVVITKNLVGFDFADFAGSGFEIIGEKILDADFADKTNTHGFLFGGDIKAALGSDFFDLRLGEMTDWEKSVGGGFVAHAIKEVSLVLILVDSAT